MKLALLILAVFSALEVEATGGWGQPSNDQNYQGSDQGGSPQPNRNGNDKYWWMSDSNAFKKPSNHPGVVKGNGKPGSPSSSPQGSNPGYNRPQNPNYNSNYNPAPSSGGFNRRPSQSPHGAGDCDLINKADCHQQSSGPAKTPSQSYSPPSQGGSASNPSYNQPQNNQRPSQGYSPPKKNPNKGYSSNPGNSRPNPGSSPQKNVPKPSQGYSPPSQGNPGSFQQSSTLQHQPDISLPSYGGGAPSGSPAQPQNSPGYGSPGKPQSSPSYGSPAKPQSSPSFGSPSGNNFQPQNSPSNNRPSGGSYQKPSSPNYGQNSPSNSARPASPNSNFGPSSSGTRPQYNQPSSNINSVYNNNQKGTPSRPQGSYNQPGSQGQNPSYNGPQKPVISEDDGHPYPGCPAAMLCVREDKCNIIGIVEEQQAPLTEAEKIHRVALMTCSDKITGEDGVCCRDPNYKDPWPDMKGAGGGQHHHHNGPQQNYKLQPDSRDFNFQPQASSNLGSAIHSESNDTLCSPTEECVKITDCQNLKLIVKANKNGKQSNFRARVKQCTSKAGEKRKNELFVCCKSRFPKSLRIPPTQSLPETKLASKIEKLASEEELQNVDSQPLASESPSSEPTTEKPKTSTARITTPSHETKPSIKRRRQPGKTKKQELRKAPLVLRPFLRPPNVKLSPDELDVTTFRPTNHLLTLISANKAVYKADASNLKNVVKRRFNASSDSTGQLQPRKVPSDSSRRSSNSSLIAATSEDSTPKNNEHPLFLKYLSRLNTKIDYVPKAVPLSEEFRQNPPIGCIHKLDELVVEHPVKPPQHYVPPDKEFPIEKPSTTISPDIVDTISSNSSASPLEVTTVRSTTEAPACPENNTCTFEHRCQLVFSTKNQNIKSCKEGRKGIRPSYLVQKVCCPNENVTESKEEPEKVFDCQGNDTVKDSSKNRFPWLGQVIITDVRGQVEKGCWAVVLTKRAVITTAHCVFKGLVRRMKLRVGWFNVGKNPKAFEELDVQGILLHPEFDESTSFHNVALMFTSRDMTIGDSVSPACIQKSLELDAPAVNITDCQTVSWSYSEKKHENSILKSNVTLTSSNACAKSILKNNFRRGFTLHPSYLCTNPDRKSHDDCNSLEGMPLVCQSKLIGLSQQCDKDQISSEIFINIPSHSKWIEENIDITR